jgi:hypothetical protein
MAELLVLTQQRANKTMFGGDVVTVQADGWPWGTEERGAGQYPMFCVIAVPGVPVEAFAEFLQPVTTGAGLQVLFRRLGLDLLKVPATATMEQVLAARLEKIVTPLLS